MTSKLYKRHFANIAIFLLSTAAAAQDELPIPAEEFIYCTVCHGTQVMGNANIKAPRLSQMDAWYVERQLHAFKNGWRGTHENDLIGMEMQPMAAALSDQQIEDVAKFVRATRSGPAPATISGDADKGRSLYQSCAACHGANAEGNRALGGPALAGNNDWYLITQLKNYKNGARGHNPADNYGLQMAAATQLLTDDEDINDVVTYINSIATD